MILVYFRSVELILNAECLMFIMFTCTQSNSSTWRSEICLKLSIVIVLLCVLRVVGCFSVHKKVIIYTMALLIDSMICYYYTIFNNEL